MNHGPLLFLAALFALSGSWFGFVLTPQMQVGQLRPAKTVPDELTYPLGRPGVARQGLEVYRANGCAYCHSQQVGQTGTVCNVLLVDAGTNHPALLEALSKVNPSSTQADATQLAAGLPKSVLQGATIELASAANKALSEAGAKSELWVVPVGPDIARGWGKRRSVAEDFLYDYPVMLGSQRIGPDLADVGARQPDPSWHLRHLYSPRLEVKGSSMPPYRFLFERRKIERVPSSSALVLPPDQAPPAGYEIVPKPQALALVAYLTSLRADAPIFDAPLTLPSASPAAATNAPADSGTSSTNAAGK